MSEISPNLEATVRLHAHRRQPPFQLLIYRSTCLSLFRARPLPDDSAEGWSEAVVVAFDAPAPSALAYFSIFKLRPLGLLKARQALLVFRREKAKLFDFEALTCPWLREIIPTDGCWVVGNGMLNDDDDSAARVSPVLSLLKVRSTLPKGNRWELELQTSLIPFLLYVIVSL